MSSNRSSTPPGGERRRWSVEFKAQAVTAALEPGVSGLTKPNHPWTNGQVERMNRTIKEATVKRFHYDMHDQLRAHLNNFLAAYNFARRLKTLSGLTSYEYLCKVWTSGPDKFIVNPDPPDAGTEHLDTQLI